mmetsp:Transcript_4207/g.16903  ORF Transcript_4207/g.16903 Transcript_4207/m.16903 type:complete len:214 (-) Transcript_4207:60-701(-)
MRWSGSMHTPSREATGGWPACCLMSAPCCLRLARNSLSMLMGSCISCMRTASDLPLAAPPAPPPLPPAPGELDTSSPSSLPATPPGKPLMDMSRSSSPMRMTLSSWSNFSSSIISSIRWNALARPAPSSPFLNCSIFASSPGMYFWQNLLTSVPPCPSNTANIAVSWCSGLSSGSKISASSMLFRQPCMQLPPKTKSAPTPSCESLAVTGCER